MDIRIQEAPEIRVTRFVGPVIEAAAPWAALHSVLDGMRTECIARGGDEVAYAYQIAFWLSQFTSIPVRDGAGE